MSAFELHYALMGLIISLLIVWVLLNASLAALLFLHA
jgi:hypothetical protein